MGKKVRTLKGCMVLAVVGGGLALAAYVFTDNLSTAIIIFCITAGLIFVAHPDIKIFIIIAGVVIALAVIGVIFLNATVSVDGSGSFRLRRIMVWLHPEEYADSWGYQTIQALYAIGSGGFFGRGLGNSIQKLGSVPEAQNDMIFSIICEELGIFGGLIVLMLYAYLLYRLFVIAQNAPDMFGSLMVSGIFIHIALQVILNIAVVVNLMPNTGVTLPFISYGGTSIVFLMAEMGLALSVARQIKFDAYVNIAGGMRLDDPAADLGIVFALVSSFRNRPLDESMVVFGEVGLSGEVRGVSAAEQRVREAVKMGFRTCIMPKTNAEHLKSIEGIKVVGVSNISQALEYI